MLKELQHDCRRVYSAFQMLFNSSYRSLNRPLRRDMRCILSRPDMEQLFACRRLIDDRVNDFTMAQPDHVRSQALEGLELGMQHEQQHQELPLTDIKHSFSVNPIPPAYQSKPEVELGQLMHPAKVFWWHYDCGVDAMDADPKRVFCFDNETPCHPVLLQPCTLADRLIANQKYLAFMDDDGYKRPDFCLAGGWAGFNMKARRRRCIGASIKVRESCFPGAESGRRHSRSR